MVIHSLQVILKPQAATAYREEALRPLDWIRLVEGECVAWTGGAAGFAGVGGFAGCWLGGVRSGAEEREVGGFQCFL